MSDEFDENLAMLEYLEFEIERLQVLHQIAVEFSANLDSDPDYKAELFRNLYYMQPPTSAPDACQNNAWRKYNLCSDYMDIEVEIKYNFVDKDA